MPGIDGAVSHVRYSHGFLYDVIGGGQAKGLCGSGLLDLAAELLRLGILDESGRLLPPESLPEELRRYVQRDDNGNGLFRLTDQVYLTAEDVRNLQLAKAAVAAGIRVLLKKQNLRPEQINGLYLAGGFGSYMDPNSAMVIGMLPRQLEGKLYALGGRIGRQVFKLAVEESIMANLLAYDLNVDLDTLKKLRVRCIKDVKEINGGISFDDALQYQKGAE